MNPAINKSATSYNTNILDIVHPSITIKFNLTQVIRQQTKMLSKQVDGNGTCLTVQASLQADQARILVVLFLMCYGCNFHKNQHINIACNYDYEIKMGKYIQEI